MAKIEITYTKASLDSGYFLETVVHPYPETDPTTLEECLIINVSTGDLVRVATIAELTSIAAAPTIRWVNIPTLIVGSTVEAGDVIRFTSVPDEWEYLGVTTPYNVSVSALGTDAPITAILATADLPCEFSAEVTVGLYTSTGTEKLPPMAHTVTVNRHDPAATGLPTYWRCESVVSMYDTLNDAENYLAAVQAGAEALVLEYRANSFVGVLTEIYE
jgi:hypothetical protein